jgi:branched-chain amino acid transport system permease protein
MLLFLVASGMSIIFGLMDILNFAQGTFFMLGAYIAYTVHHSPEIMQAVPDPNLRFLIALIIATLVGAILGAVLERGLLRPLYDRPLFQIVLTFGISIVILEATKFIWSTTPRAWTELFSFREATFNLFGQPFNSYRLFVIVIGFLLIFGIALLLQRTRIGIIIRAGVEDSEMVEALGINVRLVFTLVFTLGCAIATFGGGVIAPFTGASISLANRFLLLAIAAVALGGMGSYEGTAIGSLLMGLAVAFITQLTNASFINTAILQPLAATGTGLEEGITPILRTLPSITPMLLMVLILLLRPKGLFGKEE